ncbi:MAG: hypothetical protein ACHQXL_06550 [Candidatus Limnocylindrales bacterium]|jgi:hypothetical protein
MSTEPPADIDPDRPSEVVGALTLDDLRSLRRLLNIPPRALSLLFILAALIMGGWWLRQLSVALAAPDLSRVSLLGGLADAAADVLVVLMPVALLTRVPSALRSRGPLFAGLSILAALKLLGVVLDLWVSDFDAPAWVFDVSSWLRYLEPPAGALIAYGLLQLRVNPPGRRSLLVLLVLLWVGLVLFGPALLAIQSTVGEAVFGGPGISWWAVLVAVASGFTAWIVVDAWLDHEAPAFFWTLLSGAALWAIAARIVGLPQAVVVVMFQTNLPDSAYVIVSVASVVAPALAFVAYLCFTPRPGDATEGAEDLPR